MFFKDIVGQKDTIHELLLQYQENRIAHTQLFCSPTGVGAYELALAYARFLNCEQPSQLDACGECPSCMKMNKLIHPDVHFVFPTIKQKLCDSYLSEWREFVTNNHYFSFEDWLRHLDAGNSQALIYAKESDAIFKKLSLKAVEGNYKITLIWLPEKMNQVCANKLLKLFEEPPHHTLFFLISEEPEKLLPTILSRTQRVDIPPLSASDIANHLITQYGIDEQISQSIAHSSKGSLNKALAEIQINEDKTLFLELFINIMRRAYARRVKDIKRWSEQVAELGREKQKHLLSYFQFMVRENFIYNFKRADLNYMNKSEENFSKNFSPFINERNIQPIMEELNLAQQHIEQNVNAKMVLFDFALKLIVLLKQ
ncbi:MAG: ATP-binding protein [Bacteroides sp.]